MALDVELVVDGGVDRPEALRGAGKFEWLHLPLSASNRPMRTFGAIVQPPAGNVLSRHTKITQSRSIGAQLVRDHGVRRDALSFQ